MQQTSWNFIGRKCVLWYYTNEKTWLLTEISWCTGFLALWVFNNTSFLVICTLISSIFFRCLEEEVGTISQAEDKVKKLYHVLEHWRGTLLGLVYFWIAKEKKEEAKMGRKKIQITRIMDERNRQVRNKKSAWTGPSVILKINEKFEYIHPNSLF